MSLIIRNLSAEVQNKQILHDVNIHLDKGKIVVLMGPNGSGKSTLSNVLLGNPIYQVDLHKSEIILDGVNIVGLPCEDRAKLGLFLAFQNPISIPGVSIVNMFRVLSKSLVKNSRQKSLHNPVFNISNIYTTLLEYADFLNLSKDLLKRGLNEDFSGGEKKKLEMLQALILAKKYAIFDEIDTGLDVDALAKIAQGIMKLKEKNIGILLITHYQRILEYIKPDEVLVMVKGTVVKKGKADLALHIEKHGYSSWNK